MGLQPSRSCLYAFRDRLTPYLDGWNQQVLAQAQAKDLTTAQSGALDGSTVASAGARRQLFHRKRLDKRLQQLRQACQADALAQSLVEPPSWLAHCPQARQEQRRRYETARRRLDELLAANARRVPSPRRDEAKVVVSVSDPDAALGLDKEKVFRPLYNVQTVRDVASAFVLGYSHSALAFEGLEAVRRNRQ